MNKPLLTRRWMLAIVLTIAASLPVFYAQTASPSSSQQGSHMTHSKSIQATQHLDSIVLGAGCFWGAEKRYAAIDGVVDAISGYAGGQGIEPSYETITQRQLRFDPNNHAEVVKVVFNANQISLEQILRQFFEGHDPTQVNRQGNDVGTQYRSAIFTNSPQQAEIASQVMADYQQLLSKAGYGSIATQVMPLQEFYPAEDYHQDYLVKNPNGYCPDHSTGVRFVQSESRAQIDNGSLRLGKQILVIDSENYCPYCEKFKQTVTSHYQGNLPLSFRFASQLDGLSLKTPTWATPTILFLKDGVEVFGHQGLMSREEFYYALGQFKLGASESFNVAFNHGTDNRFCKQYDIFKNTPDGQFIDKLSGTALFDTRDRFDSGTGWLSFTQAIDGAVTEQEDLSFGMRRIEIRSASSGIHLGHVFPDGPGGKPRYCINATVLEFVPR